MHTRTGQASRRVSLRTFGAAAIVFGWSPQAGAQSSTLPVKGYARTSVNAPVFRGNSIASLGSTQYIAYYDSSGRVVLGKRTLGTTAWTVRTTSLTGTVTDAHNSISIGVDGEGFLHMAWSCHSSPLRYARSTSAGSLDMATATMVGTNETSATYPQFLRRPDGSLVFLYRDGASGNGNLMLNRYDPKTRKWTRLQTNLIAGEGSRNAYWEAWQDGDGRIHLSWTWRETSDVSTNHDKCYARSDDGGSTWKTSTGSVYALPIKAANAETVWKIAQKSDLINQTSIAADQKGRPYIATYWTPAGTGVPQYMVVYNMGAGWKQEPVTRRTTPYSLAGGGTKAVPISRPQLVVDAGPDSVAAWMVFRDVERGSKVSVARTTNLGRSPWTVSDLTTNSVHFWEPSFDPDLWNASRVLDLFVQDAQQGDGETAVDYPPQPVQVLELRSDPPSAIDERGESAPRVEIRGSRLRVSLSRSEEESVSLRLVDLAGRSAGSWSFAAGQREGTFEIDRPGSAVGLYVLEVKVGTRRETVRLVLEP